MNGESDHITCKRNDNLLLIAHFTKEIHGYTLKSKDFKGFIKISVYLWIAPKNL